MQAFAGIATPQRIVLPRRPPVEAVTVGFMQATNERTEYRQCCDLCAGLQGLAGRVDRK